MDDPQRHLRPTDIGHFIERPVYKRLRDQRRGTPPTDEEKHDAILLLAENYHDDVGLEAFRILDECGR